MAAIYLHGDKGNTITREDRNELDKENGRAMRLAMDLYEFMKRESRRETTMRGNEKQLLGTGILIPFPTQAATGEAQSAPTPAS
jgi:hypothetical protein